PRQLDERPDPASKGCQVRSGWSTASVEVLAEAVARLGRPPAALLEGFDQFLNRPEPLLGALLAEEQTVGGLHQLVALPAVEAGDALVLDRLEQRRVVGGSFGHRFCACHQITTRLPRGNRGRRR